jgi:hypothetical protein
VFVVGDKMFEQLIQEDIDKLATFSIPVVNDGVSDLGGFAFRRRSRGLLTASRCQY